MRAHMPRFATDNRSTNGLAVTTLDALAKEWGHTPVQLAIARVLSRGDLVVPVIGSRTRVQLKDALGVVSHDIVYRSWGERDEGLARYGAGY